MSNTKAEEIKEAVREKYGRVAQQAGAGSTRASCGCGPKQVSCCAPEPVNCCGPAEVKTSSSAKLYAAEDIANLPESVTGVSLGCGAPVALAELQAGETVLDLGSGGGIDCFLAAEKVGPQGKVIGLDMTTEMIKLARRNARQTGATNVQFEWGEIEEIPLPDASVDAVISNCVINLSPDKDAVFHEVYRVLRPGGRMVVADIVIDGQLPAPVRENMNAWASCVAGALDMKDYLAKIRTAGFVAVDVLGKDAMPVSQVISKKEAQALLQGVQLSPEALDRAVISLKVRAQK